MAQVIVILGALAVILFLSLTAETPAPAGFNWRGKYDAAIFNAANASRVEPALLKGIVAIESNFDPLAINPEQLFTLGGQTFTAASARGREALRDAILGGFDPASIGVDPSIGLAQVRVSTARDFVSGVTAHQLFSPETNLAAAARFVAWLFSNGITHEMIDAYNVGLTNVRRGVRNIAYRDRVLSARARFVDDFPGVA